MRDPFANPRQLIVRVYAYVAYRVGDSVDAEDITSATFERALRYRASFDEKRDNDVVFESHGLKLLVDNESLQFVRGSTIDYEESLQGAGFKVENPNVVAACGCGSSFRVADEQQVSAV